MHSIGCIKVSVVDSSFAALTLSYKIPLHAPLIWCVWHQLQVGTPVKINDLLSLQPIEIKSWKLVINVERHEESKKGQLRFQWSWPHRPSNMLTILKSILGSCGRSTAYSYCAVLNYICWVDRHHEILRRGCKWINRQTWKLWKYK